MTSVAFNLVFFANQVLFNSLIFFIGFAILYLLYWQVNPRYRRSILLIASFLFYIYWNLAFFLHFLAVVLINFYLFRKLRQLSNGQPELNNSQRQCLLVNNKSPGKYLLWIAIGFNLANLGFFKYTHAVLELLGPVLGLPVFTHHYYHTEIILPLAISFYSFQIIALHIDAYRREIKSSERINLPDYLLFIFFFPQLIAGPIMRHTDFFKQIDRARLTERKIFSGMFLICFGLVKKSYAADGIAAVIDPVFAEPAAFNSVSNLAAALGFALQLYLDFSGYTDMARGVANLLGYRIPENFRGPYFSTSFSEHWRRWHITLSTWLRDYLYIPLGGNKGSKLRTNLNLFATMSLGGLWHGHNLTFLIWGMLEGAFLVIERSLGLHRRRWRSWLDKLLAVIVVFSGSVLARIFFRADSTGQAIAMIQGLALWQQGSNLLVAEGLDSFGKLFVIGIGLHALQYYRPWFKVRLLRYRFVALPVTALVTLFLLSRIEHAGAAFIYFQF